MGVGVGSVRSGAKTRAGRGVGVCDENGPLLHESPSPSFSWNFSPKVLRCVGPQRVPEVVRVSSPFRLATPPALPSDKVNPQAERLQRYHRVPRPHPTNTYSHGSPPFLAYRNPSYTRPPVTTGGSVSGSTVVPSHSKIRDSPRRGFPGRVLHCSAWDGWWSLLLVLQPADAAVNRALSRRFGATRGVEEGTARAAGGRGWRAAQCWRPPRLALAPPPPPGICHRMPVRPGLPGLNPPGKVTHKTYGQGGEGIQALNSLQFSHTGSF